MAAEGIVELTDDNFDSEVLNSSTPVLVDFWAEWCMPCRMLAPTIDQIAGDYKGKVKVAKADTETARQSAMKYKVNAIPTVIVFKGGEAVKRFVGMTNKKDLSAALDEALA